MAITLGGHTFSDDQVIAAIQASNDPAPTAGVETIEDLKNVLQAALTRISALEDRLPFSRAGYGVVKTTTDGITSYRVQTLDQNGQTQIVTFEVPE